MPRLASIRVPLATGIYLLVSPSGEQEPEEGLAEQMYLPAGWRGKPGNVRAPIAFEPGAAEDGMHSLAFVEVVSFHWELQADEGVSMEGLSIASSLSGSMAKNQWSERRSGGRLSGDFRFTIYLGAAWIELRRYGTPVGDRIRFEVITEKIDYAVEYRAMVEDIGRRCSQLLLDWGTPTTVHIASDPVAPVQTLLEQFLFLRHVLGPERLNLYLETISRRPHSALHRERNWQPAAMASPSAFARDPLRFGRGWIRELDSHGVIGQFSPTEILNERKFDSFDTPPNRFVKFALNAFRAICDEVIRAEIHDPETKRVLSIAEERGAAWQEAVQMRDTLDAFLADPFFDDIGDLQRIPIESQALQKREGYREILHAWLMLEVAAQIDWPGRADAYDGTNRDVATLYEFWLYFVLVDLFEKQLGMVRLPASDEGQTGPLPFCCKRSDGGMRINLKRGTESICRFRWDGGGQSLLVHLFYNRRFGEAPAPQVLKSGSYSLTFRPDYSIVVMPATHAASDWRMAEELSEGAGAIAYLHLDAKYRIDKLSDLFGGPEESDLDRKEAKSTGTVKNADLHKMHTYNEAIRRTVGSYVLYPGTDWQPGYQTRGRSRNVYPRYHELIPGIGAFAVKPCGGSAEQGAQGVEGLREFLQDFFAHQGSRFTQSHRVRYWTHETVREEPAGMASEAPHAPSLAKPPKDTQVLLGYLRDEADELTCRAKQVFFCHAIEWQNASGQGVADREPGGATDLEFDPFRCDLFVGYTSNVSAQWIAAIVEVRLVTAAECAAERGRELSAMRAAYYYRFALGAVEPMAARDVHTFVSRRPGRPIARAFSDFASCPPHRAGEV